MQTRGIKPATLQFYQTLPFEVISQFTDVLFRFIFLLSQHTLTSPETKTETPLFKLSWFCYLVCSRVWQLSQQAKQTSLIRKPESFWTWTKVFVACSNGTQDSPAPTPCSCWNLEESWRSDHFCRFLTSSVPRVFSLHVVIGQVCGGENVDSLANVQLLIFHSVCHFPCAIYRKQHCECLH